MRYGVFLLSLLVLLPISVSAQNKQERIKQIRQAYAQAKKDIDENGKNGNPRMDVCIAVNDGTVVSEDFVINEENETNFYFKRMHLRGDTDLFDPCCYFIIEKTSANGHNVYREMLFDPATHHLMFSYMKAETHAGFVIESRYYYDDLGNLIETKGDGGSWSDSGGDQTMAMTYIVMFNDLMKLKDTSAESYTAIAPPDKADQIKQIRSTYAEAKKKVDADAHSEVPRNVSVTIHDQEDPAMPPQTDEIRFWFDLLDGAGSRCYFFSSVCSLGDHRVYSEYLLDPRDSHLLFCFSKQDQNEGPALEWRYYFNAKGQCIEVKGQDDRNGPGFADKSTAKSYLELFNALVNPEN